MTEATPTRRTSRQRDSRKQERRQERHTDNAALRDAVRAIGAGDATDWPQEALEGVQDARKEVGGCAGPQKGRRAAVARKNGGGDE